MKSKVILCSSILTIASLHHSCTSVRQISIEVKDSDTKASIDSAHVVVLNKKKIIISSGFTNQSGLIIFENILARKTGVAINKNGYFDHNDDWPQRRSGEHSIHYLKSKNKE